MNWLGLLERLGTFAIASGLLVWLLKSLVGQSLSRSLESFKADLQRTHGVEIERIKSDLGVASFERQTMFARLHEKRAGIIAELYKKLVQADDAIHTLLGDVQPAEEKDRQEVFWSTGRKVSELVRFFKERRIYFDMELCELIDKHTANFQTAWLYGSPYVELTAERRREIDHHLIELSKAIPSVRSAIEARMRKILGVVGSDPDFEE
jgi:hypothetical protein